MSNKNFHTTQFHLEWRIINKSTNLFETCARMFPRKGDITLFIRKQPHVLAHAARAFSREEKLVVATDGKETRTVVTQDVWTLREMQSMLQEHLRKTGR